MDEVWKDIEGWEGFYQISNHGRVKSLPRPRHGGHNHYMSKEKIRAASVNNMGYSVVLLYKNKVYDRRYVHRMVAMAFIPNPDDKPLVNHIDNNPKNNHIDNLEWCTQTENMQHAVRMGRHKSPFKGKYGAANCRARAIKQFTLSGDLVAAYDSMCLAKCATGIDNSAISMCCSGRRKTAGGYKWSYAESL